MKYTRLISDYHSFLLMESDGPIPSKKDVVPVTAIKPVPSNLGNLWILANTKSLKENYTGENLYCYEFVRGVIRLSLGGGDGKGYGDTIANKLLPGFANNNLASEYPTLKEHLLSFDEVNGLMKEHADKLCTAQEAMASNDLGEAFDDPTRAKPGDIVQYFWVDFRSPKIVGDKKLYTFTGHMAIVGSMDENVLYTNGSGFTKGFNGKYFSGINQLWTHIPKKTPDELMKGIPTESGDNNKKYNKYYRTFFFRMKDDIMKKYYEKDNVFLDSAVASHDISTIKMDDTKKPVLAMVKNVGTNKSLMV